MPSIKRTVFGSNGDRGRIATVWFLSFLWRRLDTESTSWHPVDAVTREHPLDYVARARAANEAHEFCLTFFAPIPEDVYTRAIT